MSDLEKNYLLDESMVLYQHKDHFHFNTDTKLLAQFMQVKKNERVLDIGTNNGALLLAADQYPVKELIGVELLEPACLVAQKNADTFFHHPTRIIHSRVQELQIDPVDVIVCNPPYFSKKATNPNTELSYRQLGRIEENLTLEELAFHANRLLKSNGRFYMVHRIHRLNDIFTYLLKNHFHVKTFQIAYDSRDKQAKSVLIEAIKESNCDCFCKEALMI